MAEEAKYLSPEHPDHLGGKLLYILSLYNKDLCVCSVTQSCPICDAMDCNLPVFSVHGISQARIPERLTFPPTGDFPDPVIQPVSLVSSALADRLKDSVIQKQGRKRNYNFLDLRIQCY